MKKLINCSEATVRKETETPVYVSGNLYTTFKLGDMKNEKVKDLTMYIVSEINQ